MDAVWAEEKNNDGSCSAGPAEATRMARIGAIPGSKPRKLQWSNSEPFFSLQKEDIAGAVTQRFIGSKPFSMYDPLEKVHKPMALCLDLSDIPGAQVGTLQRGLGQSVPRGSDPLAPTYRFLDGSLSSVSGARINQYNYKADPGQRYAMKASASSPALALDAFKDGK